MMPDDQFARLVADDVKNKVTDEQKRYLRLPDNRDRWMVNILALLNNLDQQVREIEEHEEDDQGLYGSLGDDGIRLLAEAQASSEERKKKVLRFRYHVEKRLDECERINIAHDAVDDEDVPLLRRAIEKHREMTEGFGIDPTQIDEALWLSLAGVWKFAEIDTKKLSEELDD
jgi:hypothetical protein